MKNAFFKLIAITLAVVMLSLCLFSCDDTTSSDGSDTNTGNNVTQNEGSSNSSDNGNTDNGGNNGENSGENNGENNGYNGENGGSNTDSDNVSKLKYNNTVAKTSYVMMGNDAIKFLFNKEGKFLGYGSALFPGFCVGIMEAQGFYIVYDDENKPDFVVIGERFMDLTPCSDDQGFEGKSEILTELFWSTQYTVKLTVDAEGRATSLIVNSGESSGASFPSSAVLEVYFNGTEVSHIKSMSSEAKRNDSGEFIGYERTTNEFIYSTSGNVVTAEVLTNEVRTGVITMSVNSAGAPLKIESRDIGIDSTYSYDQKGNLISAKLSESQIFTYTYDKDGNLTHVDMGIAKVSFSYDEKGFCSSETFSADTHTYTTKFNYNDHGFLIGYTTVTDDGLGKETVDYVSRTLTNSRSINTELQHYTETGTYDMNNGFFVVARQAAVFDKNENKLTEVIAKFDHKNNSNPDMASITINCWFKDPWDLEEDPEDWEYIGYLSANITGEVIVKGFDPLRGPFECVNVVAKTFDANGNVISSQTATEGHINLFW